MHRRILERLLGATILECRARFFAGVLILALVVPVFTWFGLRTEGILRARTTQTARSLVNPALLALHTRSREYVRPEIARSFDQIAQSLQHKDDTAGSASRIVDPYNTTAEHRPRSVFAGDTFERDALEHWRRSASIAGPRAYTFRDGTAMEESRALPDLMEYQYIQAVVFKRECIDCHEFHAYRDRLGGGSVANQPGDLACAVAIRLPLAAIRQDIAQNRAILISVALVSAIVAMVAAYATIRHLLRRAMVEGSLG